jgi:AcrR family transcriptional regulator
MTGRRGNDVSAAKRDQFDVVPTLRRPAPQLGRRARHTIGRILDATRAVFLAQGYGGTSIDDIARRAGISRASFYTYFPTKRDALLALGADATNGAERLIEQLGALGSEPTIGDIRTWVDHYFVFLDDYGSFVLAWQQAAYEDDELRAAGTKHHLVTCRRMGDQLDALRGRRLGDATSQGLLVFSMLERAWSQCRLYEGALDGAKVRENAALVIAALLADGAPDADAHCS